MHGAILQTKHVAAGGTGGNAPQKEKTDMNLPPTGLLTT